MMMKNRTKPMARKKFGDKIMSETHLRNILNTAPAEMPKKEYSEPKPKKKEIDRVKLESDLYELVYSAGGRAPGYRRQLNKILDEHSL